LYAIIAKKSQKIAADFEHPSLQGVIVVYRKTEHFILGDYLVSANTTITRIDLVDSVHQQVGLSKADAGRLVNGVLEVITKSLVDGDGLKLSSFGTFNIRNKRERIGRNPKTGIEVPITPRRVVTFRASPNFKVAVANKGKTA
jgi:integration host factor subunit alpha